VKAMPQPAAPSRTLDVKIVNQKGLHARAAAKFVKTVEQFDARVLVRRRDMEVEGGSIMGLMMLGAACGCTVQLSATGPQAAQALETLETLISGRFGEEI
jgi:phosphocarrier protein HPr